MDLIIHFLGTLCQQTLTCFFQQALSILASACIPPKMGHSLSVKPAPWTLDSVEGPSSKRLRPPHSWGLVPPASSFPRHLGRLILSFQGSRTKSALRDNRANWRSDLLPALLSSQALPEPRASRQSRFPKLPPSAAASLRSVTGAGSATVLGSRPGPWFKRYCNVF